MSKISMALRKAAIEYRQHNANEAQAYKSMEIFIDQASKKPELNRLLLLITVSFGLMLIGGIKVFYYDRTKHDENYAKLKSNKDNMTKQRVGVVASYYIYQEKFQDNRLNSKEYERRLLAKSDLRINHKLKSPSFYTIQVGSFLSSDYAKQTVQRLKEGGHDSIEIEKHPSAKGMWRRVHVGKFEAKSEAESYLSKIEKDYKDSYVIQVKH